VSALPPRHRRASGTVVSITIVPGFHTLFNCLSKAAAPEKETVSTATSHAAAADGLSKPFDLRGSPNPLAQVLCRLHARAASRDPINTHSPAFARDTPARSLPLRFPQNRDFSRHVRSLQSFRSRFAFPPPDMVSSKTSKMTISPLTTLEFRKALGEFSPG